MRMWMVDPKILCQKHLFGEHADLHLFLKHLTKKRRISGYINKNTIELKTLWQRHVDISKEMLSRGYTHKSPINIEDCNYLEYYTKSQQDYIIDQEKSLEELLLRCPKCKANYIIQNNKDIKNIDLELNVKSGEKTINGRLYPNGLLEKSIEKTIKSSERLFIFDTAEYPPSLKNLVGEAKSYNVKEDKTITFNCKLFKQTLIEIKEHLELTLIGFANIDNDNIIQDDYKIIHLILLPKE